MTYDIFDAKNTRIGAVKFEGGAFEFFEEQTSKLADLMRHFSENGVEAWRCVRNLRGDKHSIFTMKVFPKDPLFPFAIKRKLESEDYIVLETHPEVDKAIVEAIELSDKGSGLKSRLKKDLETMTYLEKTFVLESLKHK